MRDTAGDVARCCGDPKEKLLVTRVGTQDPELWDLRDQRQVKSFQMGKGVSSKLEVRYGSEAGGGEGDGREVGGRLHTPPLIFSRKEKAVC